jgi:hypothetical protein
LTVGTLARYTWPRAASGFAYRGRFDNFFLHFLSFLFLPWTLLAYVWVAPEGTNGLDWVWLVPVVLLDLATSGGGAYGNRDRIPGYSAL